jgi:TRAP-type uncharacterized transport system fused permease subunit
MPPIMGPAPSSWHLTETPYFKILNMPSPRPLYYLSLTTMVYIRGKRRASRASPLEPPEPQETMRKGWY